MSDILNQILLQSWLVWEEMAPYLLVGFLVAGVLFVLITREWVEQHLNGKGFKPVLKASLLGVPLPLCSCAVIPVATGLRRHGASKSATTAFLISTPQTGADSILATLGLMGPLFAIFRPLAALVTGIIGGVLVNLFDKEDEASAAVHPEIADSNSGPEHCCHDEPKPGRLKQALVYGFITLPRDIAGPMLIGLIFAGLIGVLVPDDFFQGIFGGKMASMLLMMMLGTPFYVCSTGSLPIAAAFILKGVSPGAVLVFLIVGPATNAATIATVWKVLGRRTSIIYLATIAVCGLAAGLLFDQIIPSSGLSIGHDHAAEGGGILKTGTSIILILMMAFAWLQPHLSRRAKSHSGAGILESKSD